MFSFLGLFLSLALASAAPAAPETVAIVGADVLPMTGEDRLIDQTVIVSGGRISAVGPRGQVAVPAGARRIDADGLTLMPGLVDMHVHLPADPDAAERALAVMLAHGVTTVRSMAGSPENLLARRLVEQNEMKGPRIYVATAPMNNSSVRSVEAARASVREARQSGYDIIKAHYLTDINIWEAVQDEARRQNLPTAGHVTNEVGLTRALLAGQQIEHLEATFLELLQKNGNEQQPQFAQFPPPSILAALSRVTEAELEALASRVAAAESYQVPTIALFESVISLARPTEDLLDDPKMRFIPEQELRQWAVQREEMRGIGYTPEDARAFINIRRRIVRAYAKAGVPIMAGSDTAQAFHVWGSGLLEEVEALAAAGLSPLDALRSATVVPRDYMRSLPNGGSSLGWTAEFGTVEPGARADLILVRGDPSLDLAALRNLHTVIAGGQVHDRAALDAMLVRAAVSTRPQ